MPVMTRKNTLYPIFAIICITYVCTAIYRIRYVPLWMDEVLAVDAAKQSSWADVYRRIWAGTDFSPPTYHFLLHVLPGLSAHTLVVSRLPSVIAVFCAALCVYRIARRRFRPAVAALAFAITLASPLFEYAVQARQYALTTCLMASALALWDSLPKQAERYRIRLLGIWGGLAACVSLHFYGVVAVGTVILCEILWTCFNRKLRLSIWIALAAVAPVFLAWMPLATHLHQLSVSDRLAPGFYARPSLAMLGRALIDLVIGGRPQLIIYGGVVFAVLIGMVWRWGGDFADEARIVEAKRMVPDPDRNLIILLLALCAIPFGAFLLAVAATGAFVPRYAVGVTLLPGLAIATAMRTTRKATLSAILIMPFVALSLATQAKDRDRAPAILAALRILQETPRGIPVLTGDGLLYIEMVAALSPTERARMAYIPTPNDVMSPDPTNENEVFRLAKLDNRFRMRSLDDALQSSNGFYLLRTTPGSVDMAYTSALRRHLSLTLVENRGTAQLYFVTLHPVNNPSY